MYKRKALLLSVMDLQSKIVQHITVEKCFVPAFSQNKLLDPKRSLYFYLKKTEIFRHDTEGNDETKLFLAINEPHMPVSSQTISKWIVKTIKMAYNGECGAVKGH